MFFTGSSRAAKEAPAGTFGRRLRINTGVLLIRQRYPERCDAAAASTYPSGQFADQDVVNGFLGGRSVLYLDHRFNYHAEFFWRGDETDVRLLHYAGTRPSRSMRPTCRCGRGSRRGSVSAWARDEYFFEIGRTADGQVWQARALEHAHRVPPAERTIGSP